MGFLGGLYTESKSSFRDEMKRENDLRERELNLEEQRIRDEEDRQEYLYFKQMDEEYEEWEEELRQEEIADIIETSANFYKKAKKLFKETLWNSPAKGATFEEVVTKNTLEEISNVVSDKEILTIEYYLNQISVDLLLNACEYDVASAADDNMKQMRKGIVIAKKLRNL